MNAALKVKLDTLQHKIGMIPSPIPSPIPVMVVAVAPEVEPKIGNNLEDTKYDGIQGKCLEMLGNGLTPEIVATALGISPGYISQLLAEEAFSYQVTQRRFLMLQAATKRDAGYDYIEDELIKKMKDLLPMMYKPQEVLRAISVINTAKRRGSGAQENVVINQTVIQLQLPEIIVNKFVKNINNQVIVAGEQQLVTIPSNNLTKQLESLQKNRISSGVQQNANGAAQTGAT
jgi:transcriptional regulator with XRE-family HTH domain